MEQNNKIKICSAIAALGIVSKWTSHRYFAAIL